MWEDLPAGDLVVRALPGTLAYDRIEADLRAAVGKL